MKKVLIPLVSFIIIIVILFLVLNKNNDDKTNFAIVSIVEIEPIAQLREGFKEVINKSEFAKENKIQFNEYNAQNDASITNQIVDKLATEKPRVIYVLGTPTAQAIQKRIPDVLLVQGAVTDPVSAGLANSWEGSGKNYIASTDLPPIKKQIELILTLTPQVKRLGVIYNPGEVNSVAVIKRLRDYITNNKLDLKLVERPVSNTSEVATAVQSLAGRVEAIYLTPDNTVHAAIPVVGKFCKEQNIPFYATVSTAINEGALATLSLDFKILGEEAAELTLKVLNGADPKTLPIQPNENPAITINKKVAEEFHIDLGKISQQKNVKII